jgi:hypothetical protein
VPADKGKRKSYGTRGNGNKTQIFNNLPEAAKKNSKEKSGAFMKEQRQAENSEG